MKGRKFTSIATAFIFCSFLLFHSLFAIEQKLTNTDVKKVMDQLFEYHIDKKEISAEILARALKIYIDQSDPAKIYLLSQEVSTYLKPSPALLQKMVAEYKNDQMTTFFELNKTIQTAMGRAKEWRKWWEQNPAKLVTESKDSGSLEEFIEKEHFCRSEAELKSRHYTYLLHYVAFQKEQLGPSTVAGKESGLVKLCERQITLVEYPFLGLSEDGQSLTSSEYEHTVVLNTLKALAHSLDAHTAYYSPDEAYGMKVQLEKGMCGIGVVLQEAIDGVLVTSIVKGSPAAKVGTVQVGDTIVKVDGQTIQNLSFNKILEILRGKEGSSVLLGIMRPVRDNRESQYLEIKLTRTKMTLDDKRVDVNYERFGDGIIGKITLYSFYEGEGGISSEKDLRHAIEELKKLGELKGLIVDLRENTGGFLSQAVKVSGLFISSGIVVISKYSDGSTKYFRAVDGETFYDGPLVLLTSKGSASAAEIVAQTLQDYGVALIVGDEQTYGKGSIQHQTVTSDRTNSFFKVTIGKYYTVSGKSTQIHGVKADIIVPTSLHYEKIGEAFLDYPLEPDNIAPAFDDPLVDLDSYSKKWFVKYYLPTIQKKSEKWDSHLPQLKINSQERLKHHKNFQTFFTYLKKESKNEKNYGTNDLQMDEAANIVKDMIYLSQFSYAHE